jgi:hypothetical protein
VEPGVRAGIGGLGALLGLLAQDAGRATPPTTAPDPSAGAGDAASSPRRTNGASSHPIPPASGQTRELGTASALATDLLQDRPEARAALVVWALTRPLGMLVDAGASAEQARALFDEWLLGAAVERSLGRLGLDDGAAMVGTALTRVLLSHEAAFKDSGSLGPRPVLEALLQDGDVRDFLGVNRYRDVLWFNQERFDALVAGLLATSATLLALEPSAAPASGATGAGETPGGASPSAGRTPARGKQPAVESGAAPAEKPTSRRGTRPAAQPVDDLTRVVGLARALSDVREASAYQVERLLRLLPI